jgi:hypothetical protein
MTEKQKLTQWVTRVGMGSLALGAVMVGNYLLGFPRWLGIVIAVSALIGSLIALATRPQTD